MKHILTIIILILLIFQNIDAQINIKKDTILIEEVKIVANKKLSEICLNSTKIDTIILKDNINSDLSELLANHSFVYIKNYGQGSLSTASFRGTAASHTQVVWNGMTLNSQMSGQVDFSQIPIFLIDDVNILYGTSSLSESSGALGGSIILENSTDWNKKITIENLIGHGSFNTSNLLLNIGLGTNKIQIRSRIYFDKSENNFKYFNNSIPNQDWTIQKNSDFYKKGILQEIYYKTNSYNIISLKIWQQFSFRNIPSIMTFNGFSRTENQKDNNFKLNFSFKHSKNNISLILSNSFSENFMNYFLGDSIFVFNNKNIFLEKNNSFSTEKKLFNNIEIKYKNDERFEFSNSLNYNIHNVTIIDSANSKSNIYNKFRNEIIFKSVLYYKLNAKLNFYSLLNLQIIDFKFIPPIPAFGVDYKMFKKQDFHVKFNISTNYHLPNLNDLYWQPGGNADLKPEKGKSGDLNFVYLTKIRNQDIEFNSSLYASLINNWIIWQPSEFRFWTAQNLNKVFARGLELSLKISGNINLLNYYICGNYSFSRTSNILENKNIFSNQNLQLIYIPKNTANIFVQTNYKNYNIKYSLNFTSKRLTSSNSTNYNFTLPAYILHNISFAKQFRILKKNYVFQFDINNIFNKQYQTILYRAMSGINFYGTLKFNFENFSKNY